MFAEPNRLHAAELPRPQVPAFNDSLQLGQLRDDLLLGAIEQNAIISLAILVATFRKIWIIVGQLSEFEVRQFPFTLAEGVVSLSVFFQQRQCDLFPKADLLE